MNEAAQVLAALDQAIAEAGPEDLGAVVARLEKALARAQERLRHDARAADGLGAVRGLSARLWTVLQDAGPAGATFTVLNRKLHGRVRSRDIKAALRELVDRGLVRAHAEPAPGQKRRRLVWRTLKGGAPATATNAPDGGVVSAPAPSRAESSGPATVPRPEVRDAPRNEASGASFRRTAESRKRDQAPAAGQAVLDRLRVWAKRER